MLNYISVLILLGTWLVQTLLLPILKDLISNPFMFIFSRKSDITITNVCLSVCLEPKLFILHYPFRIFYLFYLVKKQWEKYLIILRSLLLRRKTFLFYLVGNIYSMDTNYIGQLIRIIFLGYYLLLYRTSDSTNSQLYVFWSYE